MGEDHEGTGDKSRRIWRGDDNANCLLPDFVIYVQNGAFCSLKNTPKYVSGRCSAPDPAGSSRRSLRPPSRRGRAHPSPYSTPLGTDPPLALAMRPPGIPSRSTPMQNHPSRFWSLSVPAVFFSGVVFHTFFIDFRRRPYSTLAAPC